MSFERAQSDYDNAIPEDYWDEDTEYDEEEPDLGRDEEN